jgi:hypothetical protein
MEVIHPHCAGLDVHKETVMACVRLALSGKVTREVRTFETTTSGLLLLLAWLTEQGCTPVAMEATGVYSEETERARTSPRAPRPCRGRGLGGRGLICVSIATSQQSQAAWARGVSLALKPRFAS